MHIVSIFFIQVWCLFTRLFQFMKLKRHEYYNQNLRLHYFAVVMNILAKFNHDSTVKPGIVSFSGRKFMKIIDYQFHWLVTAGGPGQAIISRLVFDKNKSLCQYNNFVLRRDIFKTFLFEKHCS